MHQVSAGVGPDTVVGGSDSEGLFCHSRTHGDTGCGVVLGVGDDTGGDSQDDHGVDLEVGVLGGDVGGQGELAAAPPAGELAVLGLAGVHPVDVGLGQCVTAAGAPVGQVVGGDENVCVLLFLRVDPLEDSLSEEVVPGESAAGLVADALADGLEVLPGEDGLSVLEDEQGPSETALVAVDDDLLHRGVVVHVDGVVDESVPPAVPELVDEPLGVAGGSDQVSVEEDTGLLLVDGVESQLLEELVDVALVAGVGDVDDEGGVLHQTAVLTLGGLGGAQPSPLGGVKVTCLEVGLAPGQGGGDPPEVGHGGHVGGPVEKLGDSGASSDPVTGCKGVDQLVGEEVGADGGCDVVIVLLPAEVPLELVLQVLDEGGEAGPEEILHEVSGQLEPLVGVVVLVVLLPVLEGELENGFGDTAEEDGLLLPGVLGVSQVGEQGAVQDGLDLLGPVFLCLTGGKVPLEVCDGILLGVESVGQPVLGVEGVLDVGHDGELHGVVGTDGVVDLFVGFHSECFHEGDEGDLLGDDGDGDHQGSVLLLLHLGQCTVSLFLGEDLGGLHGGTVPLAVLDHDPVGGEVFKGDEDPLGSSDDEVSSGLAGVLLLIDEVLLVLLIGELAVLGLVDDLPVQVASVGPDHHGDLSDVDPLVGQILLHSVLVDLEVDLDAGHVVEVPEPGLHGGELVLVSVGLGDLRRVDPDGGLALGEDVSVLVPLPSDVDLDVLTVGALGVELDDTSLGVIGGNPDVIDDPLHPAVEVLGDDLVGTCLVRIVDGGEEVVEGLDVVVDDVFVLEV